MNYPNDLQYAETDEWVKTDGKIATIGVSDYAQDQLSDVVFVEVIKAVGEMVMKGDVIATVESVKAAADVNCPVSGKVIAVNEDLSQSPELINSDPYEKAWLVRIDMSNPDELGKLMDSSSYEQYCSERSH